HVTGRSKLTGVHHCPPRSSAIISAPRKLGLPLETHKVGVQPLLRGGEMLQQGGALPVETKVLPAMRNPSSRPIITAPRSPAASTVVVSRGARERHAMTDRVRIREQ